MIVSAYYKIPSKKPHSFYVAHLQRWIRSVINTPVLFFTTEDVKAEIESWGYPLSHITFEILNFSQLSGWSLGADFWNRQKLRDPESYHTPELAVVWYEKKEFVRRAIEKFPNENIFIWCDAGCIRNDLSEITARNGFGTRRLLDDDKIHLQYIRTIPVEKFYKYPTICIAGAIIAGNKTAWLSHCILYDSVIREYDRNNVCVNMDQYIIKSCVDLNPLLYTLEKPNNTLDKWFFFLGYL